MEKTSLQTHFKELETLIETLETTELPIEKAIDTYSKAIKVTKSSVKELSKNELKIETLTDELNEFLNDDNFNSFSTKHTPIIIRI